MSNVFVYLNASCLNCDAVEKEMVRVGVVIMCPKCFADIFITDDPVHKERKEYLKWLEVHKEKAEKEEA